MKRLFKTFLILIFALFSLGIGSCRAENLYIDAVKNSVFEAQNNVEDNIILSAIPNKDMAIASSNNNGFEIYSYMSDSEYGNSVCENSLLSNNNYGQKLARILNNNINGNSHNISPMLENEICARAP